jgi:hypothetical protein
MSVVRHCILSVLAGALGELLSVGGLLFTDVGSIWSMTLHDPNGWLAVCLLTFAFAATFGLAALGAALPEIVE